ncbi:MAG: hypothetical protein HY922_14465 [Elusimicrobia bacterium]|nr:hypothetical protein [Elusimicrobiota bacterium]
MKQRSSFAGKAFSMLMSAALLLGQSSAALAQVVAGQVSAPTMNGAAGAAVKPVSVQIGLNIVNSLNIPLADALPGAGVLPTPSALAVPKAQAQATAASVHAAPGAEASAPKTVQAQAPQAADTTTIPGPLTKAVLVSADKGVEAPAAPSGKGRTDPSGDGASQSAAAQPAVSEAAAEKAEKSGRGLLAGIIRALRGRSTSEMFHGGKVRGYGILPSEPTEVRGVRVGPKPTMPERTAVPGVAWNRTSLPGQKPSLLSRIFGADSTQPVVLSGTPQDAAGVEAALRKLIAEDPARFGGVSPDSLYTVLAKKVAGKAGLADTVYVSFRQQLDSVPVEGTYLNFTVKFFSGQAVLVHTSAQLFPKLAVDTDGKLSDLDILSKAAGRLGNLPNAAEDLLDLGVKVMHLGGAWRAVAMRQSKSLSLIAAVDINTGESFAWDPRMHAQPPHAPVPNSEVVGRGVADGPMKADMEPDVLPLGHIEIRVEDGKTYYADENGRFTVQGTGDKPVTLTLRLNGRFASVHDRAGQDMSVTVAAKPGEQLRAVFNPQGASENALAQVNSYHHVTKLHDWLLQQGIDLEALNRPMPLYTNIDDDCNAYYTPYNPSLNLFRSSERCANSAYNDVLYHEYGHALDDAAHHGIPNGGLSEGWGDILTMFLTNQPIVGRGFIKFQQPDYIREGENAYQYNRYDEVHDQGQAWMGFGWKLRKALIASLGAAQGAVLATALIIPTMLARSKDIPAAIQAVVMRDLDQNGELPHYSELAAAAKAHGITVHKPKAGSFDPLVTVDSDTLLGRLTRAIARTAKALANG